MIKAVGGPPGEPPVLILGLSKTNVERLLSNQPIRISPEEVREMGLQPMTVVLLGGETENHIMEDLRAIGWLP